jgi:hypothetical protein
MGEQGQVNFCRFIKGHVIRFVIAFYEKKMSMPNKMGGKMMNRVARSPLDNSTRH